MAASNDKKNQGAESSKLRFNEANRGTQDEVMVISMILDELPILKQRVMDKIRTVRAAAIASGRLEPKPKKSESQE